MNISHLCWELWTPLDAIGERLLFLIYHGRHKRPSLQGMMPVRFNAEPVMARLNLPWQPGETKAKSQVLVSSPRSTWAFQPGAASTYITHLFPSVARAAPEGRSYFRFSLSAAGELTLSVYVDPVTWGGRLTLFNLSHLGTSRATHLPSSSFWLRVTRYGLAPWWACHLWLGKWWTTWSSSDAAPEEAHCAGLMKLHVRARVL